MSTLRPRQRLIRQLLLCCALAGCMLTAMPSALAQSTSATLHGNVSIDSSPATEAQVTATNTGTGLTRTSQVTDGRYALRGLPPGTYKVDVTANGQTRSETVTLAVGQTATLDLGVGGMAETAPAAEATNLDAVTVVAPAALVETKTSEIATYVSLKQIEALPQASRNFLAFADTVPGMAFAQDDNGNASLRSGGQGDSNVNVYIDGVGQKSYTLPGGVSGQDTSRGNPFPQSAIAEYKVITQNYKAEFDQISSAAVVAATRSGSNDFSGDFFYDKTKQTWREQTPKEEREGRKIKSKEEQYGLSLSGPIIRDKLHYFIAYEAKEYVTPRTLELGALGRYDVNDVPEELLAQLGAANSPFKQNMYFGKLSWSVDDYNLVEFTGQSRKEDEIILNNGAFTRDNATVNANDVTRYDLRWQYSGDRWLNDAHLTYEDTSWAPYPLTSGNGYILTVSDLGVNEAGQPIRGNTQTVVNAGAGPNNQDKGQKGYGLQNDLTFTGWDRHTIKMGLKYKDVDVQAIERHFTNPQFYYDVSLNTRQPYRVEFATGIAGTTQGFTTSSNRQFGIYLQDDWEVNDRLLLNFGLRWDYETTPVYEDYVTPTDLAENLRAWPNINAPGVDYDIENYISNGRNRKAFKGAWQPRIGFSYDLNADQRHVIFGGVGRAYDRNLFDHLQIEVNRTSYARYNFYFFDADGQCRRERNDCMAWDPNYLQPDTLAELAASADTPRDWFLNSNDLKVPYSDQFSLGTRNTFPMLGHDWNSEVALSHVRSYDGIAFRLGNRRSDGSYFAPGEVWNSPWGFDPPFGRIVLIDNALETKTNSLLFKLDKPYTRSSGWGATVAYTYTDAKRNHNSDDNFAYDYPNTNWYGWLPVTKVPSHRLVATGIWDGPWGVTWSTKLTLETPRNRTGTNCLSDRLPNDGDCFIGSYRPDQTFGHKQLDLAATKIWDLGSDVQVRVRADLLNVTNARNWNSYNDWWGANGVPDPGFGQPSDGITLPTRMFKISAGFNW